MSIDRHQLSGPLRFVDTFTNNRNAFHLKTMTTGAPDSCVHKHADEELIPEETGKWLNIEKNSDLSGKCGLAP